MSPIISRWKLAKHRYCFGDNTRTKDIRKIKLSSLKECCVTLISYSISHNFPALKRLTYKNLDSQNKKGAKKRKQLGIQNQHFCLPRNPVDEQ